MEPHNESFIQSLLELGLSQREALVYVAVLEVGHGVVTEITRRAGINRTTGYDILTSLVNKGLISVSGKRPKQEYAAENPDKLLQYLKDQQNVAEQRMITAQSFIPQLKAVHKLGDRPKVRYYEGVDGLKEVYEDTLRSKEDLRSLAHVDEAENALEGYFPKYYQRRAANNIAIRAIFPDSPGARHLKTKDGIEKRKSLIVSSNEFDLKPEINVYDDKVMIASWREKLGIIIESQEIADAMKMLFELAWKEALKEDISEI
jgi:HTH-type transcriptional regulator, sugar sensing transcriptional regulator